MTSENPTNLGATQRTLAERARDQVRTHLRRYMNWIPAEYVDAMAPGTGWSGSQDELAATLRAVAAIGTDEVHLIPTSSDLDQVRPVLSLFAANILHVGPSGTGHQIKLLNQLMFGAINAMTAEMMAVAARVGVEPKKLYEIITASQAGTA